MAENYKFLAKSLDIRIDIGKSIICTDMIAAGFWPPDVERRHGGSRHPLFQPFERPLNACFHTVMYI
jgi:hypothetical protein